MGVFAPSGGSPAVATRTQLRVATAGSVDDGKSTLIGRLLYDSEAVLDDQWAAVTKASRRYGDGDVSLALLTDGLRAERQQGITIDVAYRYLSTSARSFVLADTPGHTEYTRNMVTGASVSDVAVVLVDARRGVVEQTRRHLAISALLGVAHIVVAVNKMDLVDWSRSSFDEIAFDVAQFVDRLRPGVPTRAVPMSALQGDNVVTAGSNSPWYDGPCLLKLLETLDTDTEAHVGARLGVQWVVRAHGGRDHRALAGQLRGGPLAVGDDVEVLATRRTSTVAELRTNGRPADRAEPGDAISICLREEFDVGRGDVIIAADALLRPRLTEHATVDVCWMSETPLAPGTRWLTVGRHGTTPARVDSIGFRLDLETAAPGPARELRLNEIGRVELTFDRAVALDRYADHRSGGATILVDEDTGDTVGAAMIAELDRASSTEIDGVARNAT